MPGAELIGIGLGDGRLLARLPKQALAGPEHEREDQQTHLVDQVMLSSVVVR
jgi:hypothetical protein